MTVAVVHESRMGQEQLDLLKRTLATDLTNDEFSLFAQVCQRTGLDPFMKQIYAVKRGRGNDRKMVLQVGIDGYRLIADRTGKYAGSDDAEFEGTAKCNSKDVPAMARVSVWKLVGNLRVAFTASARWAEYYPGDSQGHMWVKMPHVMLAKVAEALALRKAFPAELSGLYTQEEMDQATDVVDVPTAQRDVSAGEHEPSGDRLTDEEIEALNPRGLNDALQHFDLELGGTVDGMRDRLRVHMATLPADTDDRAADSVEDPDAVVVEGEVVSEVAS